jgi:formamidopyrimidine-DNA glycosylase
MPELPEVETIAQELCPLILGQRIDDVVVFDPTMVAGGSPELFADQVLGCTVASIERRGKYLVLGLSGFRWLLLHLRMTGRLLVSLGQSPPHGRAVLLFSNGLRVAFSDRRRLGTVRVVEDPGPILDKLGPDPLSEDFTPDVLSRQLARHHIPIKAALLDQHIVSGMGNMYADEALFAARIHPLEPAHVLSLQAINRLHRAMLSVLRQAIGGKGASIDSYVRPGGELGSAHLSFKVAHRLGEPCSVCGTSIERVQIRKRSAYFCPKCQPQKR